MVENSRTLAVDGPFAADGKKSCRSAQGWLKTAPFPSIGHGNTNKKRFPPWRRAPSSRGSPELPNMKYEIPSDAEGASLDDSYLTTKQAAIRLGYSHRTLEAMRLHKEGPGFKKFPSGAIRYARKELEEWAATASALPKNHFTWEAMLERERKAKRAARDKERQRAVRLAKKEAR